jgi:transposase InsO family protein
MKNKLELPNHFESLMLSSKIKHWHQSLRSDNAKEYFSERFYARPAEMGIKHELSAPYCPQQNGIAERENQTI